MTYQVSASTAQCVHGPEDYCLADSLAFAAAPGPCGATPLSDTVLSVHWTCDVSSVFAPFLLDDSSYASTMALQGHHLSAEK